MRMLQLKPRHAITRLALSPDGGRVAVGQPGHGVRVIETLSGSELQHLPMALARTRHRTLVSPTDRYTLGVSERDAMFAETAAGATGFRFQAGWRRGWRRNHPPDEFAPVPVDAVGGQSSLSLLSRGSNYWFVASPCALSGDHRYAVGRGWSDNEGRIALYDLANEAAVGRFRNARGVGIAFHATFTAGQLVIADMRGVSVYDLATALPAPPATEEPAPVPAAAPEPERGPIGRFVQALFRTGPRGQKARTPARLAPRPVPMLEPWATIVPTVPQPDTEIPPFALLPCGRRMLVRGEKSRVELRDVATGEVLTVWKWGLPRVQALAVTANGLLAAAAGAKGQLMLWDLE